MKRLGSQNIRLSFSDLARILIYIFFVISIAEPYLNELIGSLTKYYMFGVMLILLWRDGYKLRLRRVSITYIVWLCLKIMSLLWSEDFAVPKLHV